jgi:putative transposase
MHGACGRRTVTVHLLMTPEAGAVPSQVMKQLGQRYVQYVNRTYRRYGTLWEGRFRSRLVGEKGYLLACHRYVDLNPVQAGIVDHPGAYRWSSYGCNAQGMANAVVRPYALYLCHLASLTRSSPSCPTPESTEKP